MGKILLFVSFVITLASAAIGFINKGKLSDAKATVESTSQTLDKTKSQLTSTQKDLKTASDNAVAATQRAEQATADLAAAKSAADAATAKATDLTTQVTAKDTQITQLTADKQTLQQELDQAKTAVAPTQGTDTQETAAKIAEQETLITKLQSDLDGAHKVIEDQKAKDDARQHAQAKKGLEGRILAVNPSWNFVVLSVGDKNGIASNSEMLVKRGNQLIGKVRITSVEPSTSIADIVANSVPSGVTINPGDNVIVAAGDE